MNMQLGPFAQLKGADAKQVKSFLESEISSKVGKPVEVFGWKKTLPSGRMIGSGRFGRNPENVWYSVISVRYDVTL